MTGGEGGGELNTCELYDPLGYTPCATVTLTSASLTGTTLSVVGVGFTPVSSASSDGFNSSPTNLPVVQLQRLDSDQTWYLSRDETQLVTNTTCALTLPTDLQAGPAMLRVFVNGIASTGFAFAVPSTGANSIVAYVANGATGGTVPASQSKTYGVDLTLATNSGSLVKTGSTFTGWNTAADGSGMAYAAGATYSSDSAVTLYAKWTLNTFPVTYNANGATGGTVPAPQSKTYGVDLTLATNSGSLVKTGSTFAGWNTAADGSGMAYAAGSTYHLDASMTLSAVWQLSNNDTGGTSTTTSSSGGGAGGCGLGSSVALLALLGIGVMKFRRSTPQ